MVVAEHQRHSFEQMWESHREAVRRLLIGLSRDLDLADDLLQETYLRARAGFATYRGGDARAWLRAIATNLLRGYLRQRWRAELLPTDGPVSETDPGAHLEVLAVRQAIAGLPPALRSALIMKHYGEFTYEEMAGQLGCAVGTAKWRVSEALARLRAALAPVREMTLSGCTEPPSEGLLDYLSGLLPEARAAAWQSHLRGCEFCRAQEADLRRVVSLLDALEGDHKMMHLLELDQEGRPFLYVFWTYLNTHDQPLTWLTFNGEKENTLQAVYQEGEEARFEITGDAPDCDHRYAYRATLAHPVAPGRRVNLLLLTTTHPRRAAQPVAEGVRRFWWGQCPGQNETAYVQVVRLPAGTRPRAARPRPAETKRNGTTTLIWRAVLRPMVQFECTVDYEEGGGE